MNIIIPIGGVGKRFSDSGYDLPKPLIRTLGEHLIIECISSLKIDTKTDIIYVIYRSELDKYNFTDLINNKFPLYKDNIRFTKINFDTRGASETVLQCLINMTKKELLQLTLVLDSDNLYKDDVVKIAKEQNDNLIFYHITNIEKPIFSYIKMNDEKVIDIKEKVKITNNACIGAYCFSSGNILKESITDIIKSDIKISNEYYISSIYKYLLSKNVNIKSSLVDNYICLGTPEQLKSYSSIITKGKKLRVCFDLDNTLVTYPKIAGDYSSVEPIERNISYLRFLYSMGHDIIIYTARRMKTHSGNVGKIQADVGNITSETLKKFNIPHHEMYFGKPHADFYIDDLAIKAYDDLDKQIGIYNIHPNTRSHNKIEITNNQITKYSSDISGEKYWYENIPESISSLFPKLISTTKESITISKVNGIPLSYINTNKTLTKEILYSIFDKIKLIHNSSPVKEDVDIYVNYNRKLIDRVASYNYSGYEDFQLIYNKTINNLSKYEELKYGYKSVIHGDPVFTNILLDHNNNLFFIDMRGKLGDKLSIYGDLFYDYAKIYQSIIGYDFILAGEEIDMDYIELNKKYFQEYIEYNFSKTIFEYIKSITTSLIISLIPIHNDEKCIEYYKLIKLI